MAVFEAAEVTATPIFEIDQLLDDPHVQAVRLARPARRRPASVVMVLAVDR